MEVGENYQMTKAEQHYACRPLVARIAELEAQIEAAARRKDEVEEVLREIKAVITRGKLTLGERLMDKITTVCKG